MRGAQRASDFLGITQLLSSTANTDAGPLTPGAMVPPPGCDSFPNLALMPDHLFGGRPASEVPWVEADGSRRRRRNHTASCQGEGSSPTGNVLVLCHKQQDGRK